MIINMNDQMNKTNNIYKKENVEFEKQLHQYFHDIINDAIIIISIIKLCKKRGLQLSEKNITDIQQKASLIEKNGKELCDIIYELFDQVLNKEV